MKYWFMNSALKHMLVCEADKLSCMWKVCTLKPEAESRAS